MTEKHLSKCPVCGGELKITKMECPACGIGITGKFDLSKFSRLTSQQLKFVEVFIRSRGNIKEVEREMDISYPTVRNKLDEIIEALGYKIEDSPDDNSSAKRKEILDMLENGEIGPEEASNLLKNI
ncbi:MAG: DUF2089 domain-containing protein [Bacillota bacterium]